MVDVTASLDAATQQVLALLAQIRLSNVRAVQAQDIGAADAYVFAPMPNVTSYGADLVLVADIANPNTTTAPRLTIQGLGSVPIQAADGSAPAVGTVAGKRLIGFSTVVGGGFAARLLGLAPADVRGIAQSVVRVRLAQNTTVYVNAATGNDATADGTAAKPFATRTAAAAYVQNGWDLGGFVVTFACAGAFTDGLVINGPFLGQVNGASIVWDLGTATVTSVGTCFFAGGGAQYSIKNGGPLSSSGTGIGQGSGVAAIGGSSIAFSNLTFGACNVGHLTVSGGAELFCQGNCFIQGSAPSALLVNSFGRLSMNGYGITISGSPTFSNAFAYCFQGFLNVAGSAFPVVSGTASGQRYYVTNYGNIYTAAAGANVFPGSTSGAATPTGTYT